MATGDLISREAAVREALRCYRGAREAVRQCREAEDDFGTLAFEGQKEAFRWMVMTLMTLPEADDDKDLSDLSGGVGAGGGGRGGAGRSDVGGEGDA